MVSLSSLAEIDSPSDTAQVVVFMRRLSTMFVLLSVRSHETRSRIMNPAMAMLTKRWFLRKSFNMVLGLGGQAAWPAGAWNLSRKRTRARTELVHALGACGCRRVQR